MSRCIWIVGRSLTTQFVGSVVPVFPLFWRFSLQVPSIPNGVAIIGRSGVPAGKRRERGCWCGAGEREGVLLRVIWPRGLWGHYHQRGVFARSQHTTAVVLLTATLCTGPRGRESGRERQSDCERRIRKRGGKERGGWQGRGWGGGRERDFSINRLFFFLFFSFFSFAFT